MTIIPSYTPQMKKREIVGRRRTKGHSNTIHHMSRHAGNRGETSQVRIMWIRSARSSAHWAHRLRRLRTGFGSQMFTGFQRDFKWIHVDSCQFHKPSPVLIPMVRFLKLGVPHRSIIWIILDHWENSEDLGRRKAYGCPREAQPEDSWRNARLHPG